MKSRKLITTLMLVVALVVGAVVPAFAQSVVSYDTQPTSARTSMPGSDLWTRGLFDKYHASNGLYMAYSYYKNGSYKPQVEANLNGNRVSVTGYVVGKTVCANTKSQPSAIGYKVIATIW